MRLLTTPVYRPDTGFMMKVNLEDVDRYVAEGWTRDRPVKRNPNIVTEPAVHAAPGAPGTVPFDNSDPGDEAQAAPAGVVATKVVPGPTPPTKGK